jgi:uncharacterized NAD-dependent epimerase/dehydratase family protein
MDGSSFLPLQALAFPMSNSSFDVRHVNRLAILQHGGLRGKHGKTGLSLLRYCEDKIVAVIDETCAGGSLREITNLPLRREIPIVATVGDALAYSPQAIAIGIAPRGGRLPEAWLGELRGAVRAGVSVWNGLHDRLKSDPEIASALRAGVDVWDMRQEPAGLVNGTGLARALPAKRILFVGTDMAIGKMTAALECDREARRRGLKSKFIATGQAGMMIAGDGMCLDAVRVDYASGAVEAEMMRHGPSNDCLWVEGQGSFLNPASTATLPLIRGTQPTHLVLVHRAGMQHLRDYPHIPIPPLDRVVAMYELVAAGAGAFPRVPVVAVALNSWGLSDEEAKREIAAARASTGLPCTDAVRFGSGAILDAIFGPSAGTAPRTDTAHVGKQERPAGVL